MKVSYNWLKWYIPSAPSPEELADVFTFHICEVESLEKDKNGDTIFDVKILPNRAHDLLSHRGIAHELASILNLEFIDPTPKYKIPDATPTNLKIKIESDKCRRYMSRIIHNVKVGPSPDWVVRHLESIGQRSINNLVDAANIVMFNCGQPTHVFDLNKLGGDLVVRMARDGEELVTLDNKHCKLNNSNLVISDEKGAALAIAGVKGGKIAEVDQNTTDVVLEVANFDPVSVRKTALSLNIVTDAKKRFENNLSPELCGPAMIEFSALMLEMCGGSSFEEVVDVYKHKLPENKIKVSVLYINKRLGSNFSEEEIENVWKKINFKYTKKDEEFEIDIPALRVDLSGPHDLVEEVISVLGYDTLKEKLPILQLEPKVDEIFAKMLSSRRKLLDEGYSEVMTYVFRDKGDVEVLASASDKKFLRNNLTDGLMESLKMNQLNAPLLGMKDIKIFEIGKIFKKQKEEVHVAYNDKNKIIEMTLDEFSKSITIDFNKDLVSSCNGEGDAKFKMWSVFPFIARDIAVWVPETEKSEAVEKVIRENMGEMVVRGPELFDSFKKDGRISYAFRLVFQSMDKTLTDEEVNIFMEKISREMGLSGWKIR